MWLAALCSNGGAFPFSDDRLKRGRVLILNAEDDPERTMRPRLEKAGANLSPNKIHFQGRFRPLTKEGLQTLEAKIINIQPDLVIIDPLLTYMGKDTDTNQFSQVTEFLTRVDELAREHKICVVCVCHMTKSSGEHAINKGLGSIGWMLRHSQRYLSGNLGFSSQADKLINDHFHVEADAFFILFIILSSSQNG
jgi:RecA-family ATPase